jgi:hypothetical protein
MYTIYSSIHKRTSNNNLFFFVNIVLENGIRAREVYPRLVDEILNTEQQQTYHRISRL